MGEMVRRITRMRQTRALILPARCHWSHVHFRRSREPPNFPFPAVGARPPPSTVGGRSPRGHIARVLDGRIAGMPAPSVTIGYALT
jgi:hypothetical protein